MYLSGKGAPNGHKKSRDTKLKSLNPNAQEFVPFSVKSSPTSNSSANASSPFVTSVYTRKAVYDRSESSISNNSDEEAHQYWHHQLPDDITPDFKATGVDDVQGIGTIPFSRLSLTDVNESAVYSPSRSCGSILMDQQGLSLHSANSNSFAEKMRHPFPSYGEYPSPPGIQSSLAKSWDKQIIANDQLLSREGPSYNVNFRHGYLMDMSNKQLLVDHNVNPLEFLASEFPGFATETLTEVYFSSGGDLNQTIEILAQLEQLQIHGVNQSVNSKALSAPNLSGLDFPALSMTGSRNRPSVKENALLYRSPSGAADFPSAGTKVASQDAGMWRYDRNGSSETSIGSSRSSQALISSFSATRGNSRGIFSDRSQNQRSAQASPRWLVTGEAFGATHSEMPEDAHDHAHMHNAYFEQAQQAFLVGNQALAKELSYKGQLHNMQMKEAHAKAQEPTFHPRNSEMQANGRERIIDLHGLNVSEAIHILKRDLAVLKNAARSTDQRLLAYIYVGTGQHTRTSPHASAMLPIAVQQCLLEEGLDYSEPQPGLLRVVVY